MVLVTPEAIMPYNPADPKPYPKFPYKGLPDTTPELRDLSKPAPVAAKP